jgi:hypothetical protein
MADIHERAGQSLGISSPWPDIQTYKDCFEADESARISSKTTWQIVWARTCVLAQIQMIFS